jgi:hypothetical protein
MDWRAWLGDRLDDATKARGLILDIRRNEGGDDCGNPILARLIDRETSAWPFTSRVRFRSVPAVLADHVSTWDDSYRHLGEGGADLGQGWFALPAASAATPIQPDAKRLAMPVAVLTSPTNSSATFGFISAARASGKVTLFGQTTGGNRRGINGGGFFFTKLPASGIEFDLPLIGYFPLRPEPDAGIVPDHVVPQTAAAIAQGEGPDHGSSRSLGETGLTRSLTHHDGPAPQRLRAGGGARRGATGPMRLARSARPAPAFAPAPGASAARAARAPG